jgi:hypothetical protein
VASVHKPPTPRIGELPGHGAAPAVPPQPQGGRRVRAPGGHARKALGAEPYSVFLQLRCCVRCPCCS